MSGRLHDAVTLCHFATVDRLDICKDLCMTLSPPFWSEAVESEIWRGERVGDSACATVKKAAWLGTPVPPSFADHRSIAQIRLGLKMPGDPEWKHSGEAESIHFARKLGAEFVTDDNAAYQQAHTLIGPSRVLDTIELLRMAVRDSIITEVDAAGIVAKMRAAGRHLRYAHGPMLFAEYFSQ